MSEFAANKASNKDDINIIEDLKNAKKEIESSNKFLNNIKEIIVTTFLTLNDHMFILDNSYLMMNHICFRKLLESSKQGFNVHRGFGYYKNIPVYIDKLGNDKFIEVFEKVREKYKNKDYNGELINE